ncbi:MAG: hypothetical protein H6806_08970 [Planctomycetes bacterium]|nr:hypothetical protein [Planctomycetota bacterium]
MTSGPVPHDTPADAAGDDPASSGELFARLYGELRALAGRVAGRGGAALTLSPTVLVHEAWIKLARPGAEAAVEDRNHFLNLAARAMRQVLVSHAREQGAAKRGGDRQRERFTVVLGGTPAAERGVDVLTWTMRWSAWRRSMRARPASPSSASSPACRLRTSRRCSGFRRAPWSSTGAWRRTIWRACWVARRARPRDAGRPPSSVARPPGRGRGAARGGARRTPGRTRRRRRFARGGRPTSAHGPGGLDR